MDDLRKKIVEAWERGDYDAALAFSQELDEQILKYIKHAIGLDSKNAAVSTTRLRS